ncbi:MAG: hypothetical protein ACLSF8_00630 [Dialister invisus]|uniref:hypothetical protein n=1 Tax=Dialister invisus TaxID=218538 RepID=UPI0039957C1C
MWEDFKTSNHRLFVVGIVILLLLTGICGWWYYESSRAKTDYHDVNRSVEFIENRIQRTEKRLSDGTAEIDNAQAGLKRADATVRDVTNTARRDAAIINECEDINDRSTARIERIESIIRKVEAQNKEVGTQTSNHT